MKSVRWTNALLLAALAFSANGLADPVRAQGGQASDQAQALLEQMTPEERVGQLALVTFTGSSAGETTQVYDGILNHHVGGVVLQAGNNNFTAEPSTVTDAYQLIVRLQQLEWQGAQPLADPATGQESTRAYIPLFIGISQEGDSAPNDQLLSGLTVLPSQMAIGAAWDPDLSRQVGQVAGMELSALGFNLFFGPSLDVLEDPATTTGPGLGVRTFGGDPYWVGRMGQEYIAGLHAGSQGRMLAIAKYFPGRGSADRPSGEEAATVRKSLEQLKQIELAPFFAVTGNAPSAAAATDGLLLSHIRYQGIQGNIRAITRPVSLDAGALSQIMSLTEFSSWHESGGLIVSDDLGSQAVRRFYDPSGQSFSARLVARDALLAGNDLLFLGNIVSSDAPDNYTTVLRMLEYFVQKYEEDVTFADLVDAAVLRILTAKFELYGGFALETVLTPEDGLAALGQGNLVTFDVARQAATLINPDLEDLDEILPSPPDQDDWLVFLTDTRPATQCSACLDQSVLQVESLPQAILRLYGPLTGGQVNSNRLSAYSLTDLAQILSGGSGLTDLENALLQADWIVISMLDMDSSRPQGGTVQRFLTERQALLRGKNVILFAFNAPYYLDATDISKLTAYYGLYSKSQPFVDVAARLLFQEISPPGSLPVSVPGIGYDLLSATAPDPQQVIELHLDLPAVPTPEAEATPGPTPTLGIQVGETITLRTGVILDKNHRPVPDGTQVRFLYATSGEVPLTGQVDAATTDGIARTTLVIQQPGLMEVRAVSEPAVTSVILQLDITGQGFAVTVVPPTPAMTVMPVEATATPHPVEPTDLERGVPGAGGWLAMVAVLAGMGSLAFWLGRQVVSLRWGIRWALTLSLGGLAAYDYLAFGLAGSATWIAAYGFLGIVGVVTLGAALGFAAGLAWYQASTGKRHDKTDE